MTVRLNILGHNRRLHSAQAPNPLLYQKKRRPPS